VGRRGARPGDVIKLGWYLGPYPYTPSVRGIPDKEMLRRKARVLYDLAAGLDEMGQYLGEFVYDAEHDLFRFADGEFAFSRERLNEKRLRGLGRIE
jgi:hypothetical protein